MPSDETADSSVPFSNSKTREQLILELADSRSQQTIKDRVIQAQAQELARLRSIQEQPSSNTGSKLGTGNEPLAIMLIDRQRRVCEVNRLAARFAGRSESEMVGLRGGEALRCLYHLDDPQGCGYGPACSECRVRKAVLDTFDTGTSQSEIEAVMPFLRDDGLTELSLAVSTAYLKSDGKDKVLVCARDITDRKKAVKASLKSENLLASIFRAAPTGIGVVNQRILMMVNDRLCEMVGYDRPELVGKSARMLYPNDADFDYVGSEKYRQIAQGGTGTVETKWLRRDGRVIDVLLSSTPNNPADMAGPVTFTALDITERKRAEEALQELTQTLEARVVERTALAEARTKQLQVLAVELIESEERERQRIAALLHEDLQQLLAAARFILQSKRRSDPQLKEVQHLLEESIAKSRNLSHELSPAMLHQTTLTAALEWLCRNMREQFGLHVELHQDPVPALESKPVRVFLFRAVRELLFNIVKHAGVDRAQVKLAGKDDELIITVSDLGVGFDKSVLETCKPNTGLGLASLRERASYIGGSLVIESTPGQGSRLTLQVPMKIKVNYSEAHAIPVQTGLRTPAAAAAIPDEPGIRVLFADDHKVMRQGLIRLVSGKPNLSVVGEAADGCEAIKQTMQLRPDVVVMDVSMPEMDGIEATRHIKAELPGVRVIGLSMHEDEHVSRAMREAGAEAFVSKTASSSQLLEAIYGSPASISTGGNKKGG